MTEFEKLKQWIENTKDEPLEEMAGFFGARLGDYEAHMSHWKPLYEQMGLLIPKDTKKLLDIGCGTGLELDEIWKRQPGISVTGIDLTGPMLDVLRKKYPGKPLTLIEGDYFEVPFGTECFDVAVSFETLHHYPAQKKLTVFQKLYDCLKPGGCYLEADYIADDQEWEDLLMRECARRRRAQNIPANVFVHFDTPLTLANETALLRSAGFQTVDVLTFPEEDGTPIIRAVR